MRLQVKGKNVDVSPSIRTYAEEKLGKLSKQLADPTEVEIELAVEKNPSISDNHIAEATIRTKGPTLRAREASVDMKASIDQLVDKLERQVKRYREKRRKEPRRHARQNGPEPGIPVLGEDAEPSIVKTKQFAVKPMTPEEAVLQLELIGHDFFVFRNDASGDVNVVYRRRAGDYGADRADRLTRHGRSCGASRSTGGSRARAASTRPPVDTRPQWGEVGIHGVHRPREWDAVVAAEAGDDADEASFVVLPDGSVVVESGPEQVEPLAEAIEQAIDPPFRAEAVRRGGRTWGVAARRIRVLELDADGEELRLTVTPDGREYRVDGMREFGGNPELERLLEGDGVVTARRIDGSLWQADVDRL